ncbi:MAG: DNA translocase FtsK [Anaerolineales bacterium]|nr:DNA translocase FtsK [Anaerolineales bacterium]
MKNSPPGRSPARLPKGWERIAQLLVLVRPYAEDVAVVLLGLSALLCLIALLGLAHGSLIDALGGLLRRWLGWGAAFLPLALLWTTAKLLLARLGRDRPVSWTRVIAVELAVLAGLGLASLAAAPTLAESESGRGGGLIGWGIHYLLGQIMSPIWEGILLAALIAVLAGYGLDLSLETILRPAGTGAAGKVTRGRPSPPAAVPPEAGAVGEASVKKTASAAPAPPAKIELPAKQAARLPDAFRKNLKPGPALIEKQAPARIKRERGLPSIGIFEGGELTAPSIREINQIAGTIEKTLAEFGVPARVISFRTGPTVTQYGVEPGFVEKAGSDGELRRAKVRVSQISSLTDDLALALAAPTLRIEAPVPGQSYVGIEVPHRRTSLVRLRMVMESAAFQKVKSPLAVALGLDVAGAPHCADLAGMPHLLIGGTTGSGKSVCITALTACLVANNPPERLRLVLIDPKMVELVRFNGLPHILGRVETELERIVTVLRWCTREMDRRYKLLEELRARHIDDYNRKAAARGEGEPLPRLVVLLDEMADLMMTAPDETERHLIRLAQMARAVGIHLVVATQRPSTDVVTGLIKANFPARIAFAVPSSIESRVILDTPGAESLLGRGDMLYLSPEAGAPVRLQGCFVTDREITRLIDFWKEQYPEEEPGAPQAEPKREAKASAKAAEPAPAAASLQAPWEDMVREPADADEGAEEEEIDQAAQIIRQYGRASASLLQRKMRLGYPKAARLMDELQKRGIIGRQQTGGKTREVLRRGEGADDGENGEDE